MKMKEKAKELQRARQEAAKRGIKSPGFGNFVGSSSVFSPPVGVVGDTLTNPETPKPSYTAPRYYF